jgi:hypothetical protein
MEVTRKISGKSQESCGASSLPDPEGHHLFRARPKLYSSREFYFETPTLRLHTVKINPASHLLSSQEIDGGPRRERGSGMEGGRLSGTDGRTDGWREEGYRGSEGGRKEGKGGRKKKKERRWGGEGWKEGAREGERRRGRERGREQLWSVGGWQGGRGMRE